MDVTSAVVRVVGRVCLHAASLVERRITRRKTRVRMLRLATAQQARAQRKGDEGTLQSTHVPSFVRVERRSVKRAMRRTRTAPVRGAEISGKVRCARMCF